MFVSAQLAFWIGVVIFILGLGLAVSGLFEIGRSRGGFFGIAGGITTLLLGGFVMIIGVIIAIAKMASLLFMHWQWPMMTGG